MLERPNNYFNNLIVQRYNYFNKPTYFHICISLATFLDILGMEPFFLYKFYSQTPFHVYVAFELLGAM